MAFILLLSGPGRSHESSEFKRLLLDTEGPDILEASNNDADTFWSLINRHDTTTEKFWVSELENLDVRDKLFYHFTRTNMRGVCLFLHLTAGGGKGSASKMHTKWDLDAYFSNIDVAKALQYAGGRAIFRRFRLYLKRANASYVDGYGEAALHYAVKHKDLLMVLMILEHRADVVQPDAYG